MTGIAEKLDTKLKGWRPETARMVERVVAEILESADHDCLDLGRGRQLEQEVLDLLDEPQAR